MTYICPLMSSASNKVECTTQCALFLKDGKNATCAININAAYTLEIQKLVESLCRNNGR